MGEEVVVTGEDDIIGGQPCGIAVPTSIMA